MSVCNFKRKTFHKKHKNTYGSNYGTHIKKLFLKILSYSLFVCICFTDFDRTFTGNN